MVVDIPVLPYLLPVLLNLYGSFYYKADSHLPHRSGDYEDYEEYLDNWRSALRKRRRGGPGLKRARVGPTTGHCETDPLQTLLQNEEEEEEEEYPLYYSDDWKTSDYKYWGNQRRGLESEDKDLVRNMVVGLADRVNNAVNMIA